MAGKSIRWGVLPYGVTGLSVKGRKPVIPHNYLVVRNYANRSSTISLLSGISLPD
jgi:hypothetical protein